MRRLLGVGILAVFISPAFFYNPPEQTAEQKQDDKTAMLAERRAVSAKCTQEAADSHLGDDAIIRATLQCMRDRHQWGY